MVVVAAEGARMVRTGVATRGLARVLVSPAAVASKARKGAMIALHGATGLLAAVLNLIP